MEASAIKSKLEENPLVVRLARPKDRLACSRLEGTYQTDYVWQMHLQEGTQTVQVTFNRIRLPRLMPVDYPYSAAVLEKTFDQSPCLLTAYYRDQLLGCLDGSIEVPRQAFNIQNFIVHPQARRRGVGQYLLESAKTLARKYGCRQMTLTLQTKNNPAITFAQKTGFVYCGYNDLYFENGDIALTFSLKL